MYHYLKFFTYWDNRKAAVDRVCLLELKEVVKVLKCLQHFKPVVKLGIPQIHFCAIKTNLISQEVL